MRKRIFGLIAAAVMMVSSTLTAFADTTTGLIGQYNFDGDLANTVDGAEGIIHGAKIDVTAPRTEGLFANGVDGEALLIKGSTGLYAEKYGVEVLAPDSNTFTISYDIYYLSHTKHTPTLFLGNVWGTTTNEDLWLSFGYGFNETLAFASGCWSFYGGGYKDYYNTVGYPSELELDENNKFTQWVNITYTCDAGVLKSYVNGQATPLPNLVIPEGVVVETSRMFIGINAWDTPLEAGIDNLYIYDRALTEEDVNELIALRDYDAAEKPAIEQESVVVDMPEKNTTIKNDNDRIEQDVETLGSDNKSTTAASSNDGNDGGVMTIVIVVVVVVVVVAAIFVVLSMKKKSGNDDDDDDDDY